MTPGHPIGLARAAPAPVTVRLPAELWVVAVATVLAWAANAVPASLPPWAPWDFSWPAFLGIGFTLVWFVRGWRTGHAIGTARATCFLLGLASLYFALLTRFEYAAQHMFLLNRLQHAILHHAGPFLIALSWPGETIAAGMPAALRRGAHWLGATRAMRFVQHPVVALVLFQGLLYLWLIPPVTFRAMLDPVLYAVMNASMVIDGLLFWFLVLDPRPLPQASIGYFPRLALAFTIIFPQIAVGTLLGLARTDLYPSFALCGRLWSGISPLADQQLGGLILWIPAGMMSAFAAVLIMRRMFTHEDSLVRLAS
ncbi:MAG: hypothetical protein B7Z80_21720 [Rhodospirillales bacterium 20-64-7]|nr:MAG: hypothetical protein B7Z80_21720 [Rhodospirillales bacterium 20-64-7]HQT78905.1 cytochrome c oxidase assembly protein [Rhodopila sp.]